MATWNIPTSLSRHNSTGFFSNAITELKEIESCKIKIQQYDSFSGNDISEEYYQSLDAIVEDNDALEQFHLRHTFQECLKACTKEIQEEVMTIHHAENYECACLPKDGSVEKNGKARLQNKKLSSKSNQLPKNFIPGRHTLARANRQKCCQVQSYPSKYDECRPSTPESHAEKMAAYSFPQNLHVQSNSSHMPVKNYIAKAKEISQSLSAECSFGKNIKMNGQYFPCAIQLAEPCRVRAADFPTLEIAENASKPPTSLSKAINVAIVNIDAQKCTKSDLVDQVLPSIHIKGKPFQPVIVKNAQLFSFNEAPSPVEQSSSVDTDISCRDMGCSPIDTRFQTATEEGPQTICVKSNTANRSSGGRMNPIVPEIPAAVLWNSRRIRSADDRMLPSSHESGYETGTNAKESEDNLDSHRSRNAIQSATKAVQVAVPRHCGTLVSNSVQVSSPKPIVFDKFQQTEKRVLKDSYAQTDLQGRPGYELVFHQACDIHRSHIPSIPTAPYQTMGATNQTIGVPLCAVSSASLDHDLMVFDDVPSLISKQYREQSTDTNRSVSTKDIGIQPVTEVECQTLPEKRDVCLQAKCQMEGTTKCTMTKCADMRDMSSQVSEKIQPTPLEKRFVDRGTQVKQMLDVSIGSDTAVSFSDNEFVDDLLSEGEIPLPWNLRLLSKIDRGLSSRHGHSAEYQNEGNDDNSLSEGEIPPAVLRYLEECRTSSRILANSGLQPDATFVQETIGFRSSRESIPSMQQNASDGSILTPFSVASSNRASSSSDLLAPSGSEECSFSESEAFLRFEKPCKDFQPANSNSRSRTFYDTFQAQYIRDERECVLLDNFVDPRESCLSPTSSRVGNVAADSVRFANFDSKSLSKNVSRIPELNTVSEEASTGSSCNSNEERLKRAFNINYRY